MLTSKYDSQSIVFSYLCLSFSSAISFSLQIENNRCDTVTHDIIVVTCCRQFLTIRTFNKCKFKGSSIKMYYTVNTITIEKKKILVPSRWCFGINFENTINEGLNKTKKRLIFYFQDEKNEANFSLPVSRTFTKENACYFGRTVKFFSKYLISFQLHALLRNAWL